MGDGYTAGAHPGTTGTAGLPVLDLGDPARDRLRQALNLALPVAQIVVTVLCFYAGTSFDDVAKKNGEAPDPPVIPAGYAFIVWSLIYAGAVAYGFYQASPRRKTDPLLRAVGFYTAGAFLAVCLWLVAVRLGLLWLPVGLIFAMLAALVGALIALIRHRAPRTTAESWLVVAPVSVFAGWVTVAAIANTASALKNAGFSGFGISESDWAVAMLAVGGAVGSAVTVAGRGNVGYALTLVWAFAGIAVANVGKGNVAVTAAAGIMAAFTLGALGYARRRQFRSRG